MPSRTYRTRLDAGLADALEAFAVAWQQPISAMLRDLVRLAVRNPQFYAEALSERFNVIQNTSTLEQEQAAMAYIESLSNFSLADIVAELPHP